MVRQCTQCRVRREEDQFQDKNQQEVMRTCRQCRERTQRSMNKNKLERQIQTKQWKEQNVEYTRLYNEFYRNYSHLPKAERELIFQEIRRTQQIPDRVRGVASGHRKQHREVDGVMGKDCSVADCGWKPLTEFNFNYRSWDQLRTTCKSCLSKKRSKYFATTSVNVSQESISYRLNQNVRGRIITSIHDQHALKNQETIHYLGCTMEDFKKHIESLFTDGMCWEKYGFYLDENGERQIGFQIDHIIPCCAFNLDDPLEFLLCFHWKNCQPMWGRENMSKGGKYRPEDKIRYIESQRDLIHRDKADALVQMIRNQIEQEQERTEQILQEEQSRLEKQKELYSEYVHNQCLEGMQIMFFIHENKIDEKSYKATPISIMKNHQSRKSGAENPRSKFVCKLSMDGELLATYESMNQAAHDNKTFHTSISKCCNDPLQLFHAGGFRWCFEHNLSSFQQRCRHVVVMRQLCEKIPRNEKDTAIFPVAVPQSHSRTTREKIGETMRQFFETEAGRQSKKEAFKKRSETMKERREQIRATITEKQCRACLQTLPVAIFSKRAAAADGLQPYCRPCFQKKKQNEKVKT